ncbi:hypothetical protein [Streptomyces acidicola]|uniref:hypothetical protein n=1 Tax=Streptomyces acidicola TaxID=2596892 RepID=UPI0037FB29A1
MIAGLGNYVKLIMHIVGNCVTADTYRRCSNPAASVAMARRGVATRYDKTPDSYLADLHLRASMIWIKDLTRTTH